MTSTRADRGSTAIVVGTAALLSVFAFVIGGEIDGVRTGVMLSLAVLLVTAAFGRAAYAGSLPRPFRGSGFLMLMTLFATLSIASVGWSVLPGASYVDAVRTIAYTAIIAGAALAAQLLPTRAREVTAGLGLAALLIALYSLTSRVMPGWFPPTDSFARLRMPFEYWNAVGAVAVFGLLSALWLGTTRESNRWYVTASFPVGGVFFVALALSQSRGAILAALICTAIWLLVVPRRLRSCSWLAAVGAIGSITVAWAYSKPALSQDKIDIATRESDGRQLGLMLLLMLLVLTAVGVADEYLRRTRAASADQRRTIGKALLILAAIAPFVLFGGIAGGTDKGLGTISDSFDDLTNPSLLAPTNSPERLTQTSSVRARYWNDAFKIYDDHKLHGTGGNTYSVARLPYRKDTLRVQNAHGFVPQVMSDLGTLGLLLIIAIAGAWLYSALRLAGMAKSAPYRWLDSANDNRIASNAIMLIGLAFGIHSALDWTWFEPGVAAFGLVAAGWVIGVPLKAAEAAPAAEAAATKKIRTQRIVRAAGVALVGIAVAYAVYQPARAERLVTQGYDQLADGEAQKALQTGQKAHDVDPVSAAPYFLIASAQNNLRQRRAADHTLLVIAGQQPANPDTWLRLADYRLNNEDDPTGTFAALRPLFYISPNNERGLVLLDQAKKARIKQLIDIEIKKEKAKIKREIERLKKQLSAATIAAPAGTP